jgi:hypothetical protein
MADNEKDAFKLGFLARCAEEGLTGDALDARIKSAEVLVKTGWDLIPSEGRYAAGLAAGLPIAAGVLGGGALGYGLAKMQEPPLDEDEIKANEIATTYRVLAQRAKARKKLRQYRPGS